jgi:predicted patatin/cPLA2 family phospholipase
MIETNIDVSMIKNSGRKVRFGAVAYDSGRYFEATEEYDNLHQWIAASAAFPGILCPQEIYGDLWVDGGVRRITPLKGAIDAGADEIDVIVSSPRTPNSMLTGEQKNANAINVVLRSIELMSDELFARDIDFADLYNDLIKQGIMIPGKRQVKINVYEPKEQFTKGELGSLQFDPKHILEMIEKGKQVKI